LIKSLKPVSKTDCCWQKSCISWYS